MFLDYLLCFSTEMRKMSVNNENDCNKTTTRKRMFETKTALFCTFTTQMHLKRRKIL